MDKKRAINSAIVGLILVLAWVGVIFAGIAAAVGAIYLIGKFPLAAIVITILAVAVGVAINFVYKDRSWDGSFRSFFRRK